MLVPPKIVWYSTVDLKELQCRCLEKTKQLQ